MDSLTEIIIKLNGNHLSLDGIIANPIEMVALINQHPEMVDTPLNISNIPGVMINDQPNPFFIFWFNSMLETYGHMYPIPSGLSRTNFVKHASEYRRFALIFFDLVKHYGFAYDYFNFQNKFVKLFEEFDSIDKLKDINSTESTEKTQQEAFPNRNNVISDQPDSINDVAISNTHTSNSNIIYKLDLLNKRFPNFWSNFIIYFTNDFVNFDYDRV